MNSKQRRIKKRARKRLNERFSKQFETIIDLLDKQANDAYFTWNNLILLSDEVRSGGTK